MSKSPVSDALVHYKEPKRFVEIAIQKDPGKFLSSPAKFHNACANLVRMGIRAASKHIELPVDFINESIDEFVEGGFKNGWTYVDKTWKRSGIRCVVECELRIDSFQLTQCIYCDGKLVAKAMIARTKPREWLFFQLFGTLTLSGSQIVCRSKKGVLSRYDLTTGKLTYSEDNIAELFVLGGA